jgi:hypothetical protein
MKFSFLSSASLLLLADMASAGWLFGAGKTQYDFGDPNNEALTARPLPPIRDTNDAPATNDESSGNDESPMNDESPAVNDESPGNDEPSNSRPPLPPREPITWDLRVGYKGGRVIENIKVVSIMWGGSNNVESGSRWPEYYAAITQSSYMDWLSEYDTPNERIGRGSHRFQFDHTSAPMGTVSDDTIRWHLKRLIDDGLIPRPDINTYYAIHMPRQSTVNFVQPGNKVAASCKQFCAYHSWHETADAAYGVVPDVSGECASICGRSNVPFENHASAASHEMIEAITDPVPGKSWWDARLNEISDICNHQHGKIAGFTVQRTWSNKRWACILD